VAEHRALSSGDILVLLHVFQSSVEDSDGDILTILYEYQYKKEIPANWAGWRN
jgi:hypothetical protein